MSPTWPTTSATELLSRPSHAGPIVLFIEAVFLDADRPLAERKSHLTARAAGEIARAAEVKSAVPFHFSPRYLGREDELRQEFAVAWLQGSGGPGG